LRFIVHDETEPDRRSTSAGPAGLAGLDGDRQVVAAGPSHFSSPGCRKCSRGEGRRVWRLAVSYAGGRTGQFAVRRRQMSQVECGITRNCGRNWTRFANSIAMAQGGGSLKILFLTFRVSVTQNAQYGSREFRRFPHRLSVLWSARYDAQEPGAAGPRLPAPGPELPLRSRRSAPHVVGAGVTRVPEVTDGWGVFLSASTSILPVWPNPSRPSC
jgi:hypothetical protein